MKKFLTNRTGAVIVAVIIVLLSTYFGAYRSLGIKSAEIADGFNEGVYYTDGSAHTSAPAGVELNFYTTTISEDKIFNVADFEATGNVYNPIDKTVTPPPAGGGSNTPASGDTKQVVLTEANLTMNRIWDSGWEGTANFSNPANLFDGDATTYSEWDQYKDDGTTADCLCEFIIDFGTVKNITNVTIYTGAEHFGPDWWSNAAPMNAEILVAGEDEVYTSVYTYDSDTVE